MAEFDDYCKIDKIVSLQEQLEEIRTDLRVQVFEDFNRLSAEDGVMDRMRFETLSGACAVADALGHDVRKEMILWFCNWQFAPYKHVFAPTGECGTLEKTELRYVWHQKK